MKQQLFSKDFTLVIIGQIISLFGNAIIRFALPLYLLNLTGSSALYGAVTACAFIPAILLSPIGGIAADRVNKRNIMVVLDFFPSDSHINAFIWYCRRISAVCTGKHSRTCKAESSYGCKFCYQYYQLFCFPYRSCTLRHFI